MKERVRVTETNREFEILVQQIYTSGYKVFLF